MRSPHLSRLLAAGIVSGLLFAGSLAEAAPAAAADGASISGTVTYNGDPQLTDVFVTDQTGAVQGTSTDASGFYSFTDLDYGTYTLFIYEQPWRPGLIT